MRDPPHGIKALSKDQLASQLFEDGAVTLPPGTSTVSRVASCRSLQGRGPKIPADRTTCFFTMSDNTPIPEGSDEFRVSWTRIPHSTPPQRGWWSQTGSNRRPHACKARALPTELWPQFRTKRLDKERLKTVVGLGGLEPPTSRLSSARSNQLSYKPASRQCGPHDPAAWARP